jgi:hypothetical protein
MNRKTALAGSALLLAMALSTPRAWSHGDSAPDRVSTPAAQGAALQQCIGPAPQATASRAKPGCLAQPG